MSGDSRSIFRKPRVLVHVLELRRTNLCGADLVGRSLVEADLGGAKWDKADLRKENLSRLLKKGIPMPETVRFRDRLNVESTSCGC
jgi:uncharacterized protein YjbI with pentapeptide repeats